MLVPLSQMALCPYWIRIFAHSAFACGSMVLYRYCGSFFRPAGQKNDPQGIEHDRQAKILAKNQVSAAQCHTEPLDSLANLGLINCGVAKQQAAALQRFQRVGP